MIVNMDFVLQLIIEALIQRNAEEEKRLKQVYIDGDTDGDGVLSFEEFKSTYDNIFFILFT